MSEVSAVISASVPLLLVTEIVGSLDSPPPVFVTRALVIVPISISSRVFSSRIIWSLSVP